MKCQGAPPPTNRKIEFSSNSWRQISSLRVFLLLASNCWLTGLPVHIQGLRSLVDLAVTTSTEVCQPEMLPRMTVGGRGVLIHDPTVRAESDLLSQMSVQGDRYSVQTLSFVDLGNNEFLVKVEPYLGEDNSYQRAGSLFVEHMF